MERLPMYRAREILRLRWVLGLGVRQAASSAGIGHSVVSKTTIRAEAAGLNWAAVEAMSDADLERRLYGPPRAPTKGRAEPDPLYIHRELGRPGVTLELLHLEYLREHPGGYRYTAFCNPLPALAEAVRAVDAASARGGREDVRRLLGQEALHRRSADG